MTAAPLLPIPTTSRTTPLEGLMVYASTLATSGRAEEAEAVLRDAMTIEPDDPAPYHELLTLILRDGRDVEAFAFCASMLARLAPPSAATLRTAAQAMLVLHERHAHLLEAREEPHRLHLAPMGVLDPTPLVMAPEFLKRARTLARQAMQRDPQAGVGYLLVADCELRAGNATAARTAAERAVDLTSDRDRVVALLTQAIAAFADHREGRALELLGAPRLTESLPSLGTGQVIAVDIDQTLAPATIADDPQREAHEIPYHVIHHGVPRNGVVTVRIAAPVACSLTGGRIVGGEWVAIGGDDRAIIHGITDPVPRARSPRELVRRLTRERNRTLWRDDDRILLHAARIDREHAGRAVLLGGGGRSDYSRWLIESIGRLSAIPGVLHDPDIRFVVPAPLLPFQSQLLAWLGVGEDRLAPVADHEVVAFEELIVVRHRSHGECVAPSVIGWLRDALTVPRLVEGATPHRRIFLRSAAGDPARLLLNEPDVERLCTSLGFESIDAEALSLGEQRDLFADAACIVSADQPLLANLLFAPAGAQVVILSPRSFARPRHAALAHALGQSATYVLGAERPTRASYPAWEYAVDVGDVRSAIRRAFR